MPELKYRRVLLKLSGEALMGNKGFGIDPEVVTTIAEQIKEVKELGVEIAIVVGGGNIFRGLAATTSGIDRATGQPYSMLLASNGQLRYRQGNLVDVGTWRSGPDRRFCTTRAQFPGRRLRGHLILVHARDYGADRQLGFSRQSCHEFRRMLLRPA